MRNRKSRLVPAVGLASLLLIGAVAQAAPRVDLELITEPGTPLTSTHEWLAALKDQNLGSVRMRTAQPGEREEIRQRGSESAPTYHVLGVLTPRNTMRVPGAEFRLGDKAALKQWLAKLADGGPQGLSETTGAFGLTARQLVSVNECLSAPVTFETRGQKPRDALRRLASTVTMSFASDERARQALAGDELIADELKGLSVGTAAAAILRPLGLVLVPQKQAGGEVKLLIADVRQAAVSWPVGWPPQKPPRETLPELFSFLNVEIEDRPLMEAVEAIAGRLKAPLLIDHNSLARQRINPERAKVNLPASRTYYQRVLDKVLYQAKLKFELRVDEAKKPFLWISTLKQ